MSEENVEIVHRILDSWAKGDFREGVDDLDPYVSYVVRPPLAEPTACVGPEAISNYMREFLRQWVGYVVEAKELQRFGDTVLASAVSRAAGRRTGIHTEASFFILFTFRGRSIVRMEFIVDKDEVLQAIGLSE
jgi:ketosteroid isomerase-like protein